MRTDLDNPQVSEEEILKQHLLSKAQISIMLKDYNDLFNSFDPRPYSHRSLSDDLLKNAKNAAMEKDGALEISFMIPKNQRNFEHEVLIRKRLRDHFKRHASLIEHDIKSIKKRGYLMAVFGVFMITVASILLSLENNSWLIHFLIVLLEPAGWFTAWTGLDEVYYTVKQKKPDFDFYKKMNQAEITFHAY